MSNMSDSVLELAAQIVSAHIANNAVATDQLPKLINDVHHALATAGQVVAQPPKPEPAVPVNKSVRADHIVCLDCGKHFSMLKRHLMTDHKLTVQQYRQKWGLPSSYPVVSPDYAKTRSALAKKIGLGRLPKAPRKTGRKVAARKASAKR
jgi:predicted transcriptional regulator